MAAAADESAASSGAGTSNAAAEASASAACLCPICIETFRDEAYLDACLHSFCFKCITLWVKIVASKHEEPLSSVKCPLCKTENVSVIHAFDGETFQRHTIGQDPGKRRLSDTEDLISQIYKTEEISDNGSSILQYWKQRQYLRKNVWLETWLRKEIQALTQVENAEAIVYHIHGVIESFMKRQEKLPASKQISPEHTKEEFRSLLSDAARPFLLGRTERFVVEVELFLISQRNMDAYGKVRVQRFHESASHVAREQDALPHDRSLEKHYLYLLSDETGGQI